MADPVIFKPGISGLPLSGSDYNSNWGLVESSLLDIGPYVITGLVPSIATGLAVNVSAGTAVIGAHLSLNAFSISPLAPNTTNWLWLQQNGHGLATQTSTPPANSVLLGTAATGASTVTSVATGRGSGRQQFQQPQSLIPGGPAAGITSAGHPASINLANWAAAAAEGVAVSGVLPPGAGGGNMIGSGTVAARPAPSLSGTEYLPADGIFVYRDTGALWSAWGPIWPLTDPAAVSGSFVWVNQGGASVDTTRGGIFLDAPATAGANLRVRKIAAPATPYNITLAFLPAMAADAAVFPGMGLCFRESGTGKLVTFSYTLATTTFARPQKWTNETTFSAGYTPTWDAISNFQTGPLIWMRITDTGANLQFWLSNDNRKWFQTFSISRTDFMAAGPNEVGFWVNTGSASYDTSMWLLHWSVS